MTSSSPYCSNMSNGTFSGMGYITMPFLFVRIGVEFESGLLASFPRNMRQFIRDYKRTISNYDKDAYYVFVIKDAPAGRAGFMPFKRQFGFIFSNETPNLERTIAHELGHVEPGEIPSSAAIGERRFGSAFRLRHTFSSKDFIANQGDTDNLMDYSQGNHLHKQQWDYIHHPQDMIGWFEDDEEGEYKFFIDDYSDYNISGSEKIISYIVENKYEEFISLIKSYNFKNKSDVNLSCIILKEVLPNIIIGDPKEALMIINVLLSQYSYFYLTVDRPKLITLIDEDYSNSRNSLSNFFTNELGVSINIADHFIDFLRYLESYNKSNGIGFSKSLIKEELTPIGVKQLLVFQTTSQFKYWLDLRLPDLDKKVRYEIIQMKKSGKLNLDNGYLKKLARNMNVNSINKMVDKSDDFIIAAINSGDNVKTPIKSNLNFNLQNVGHLMTCITLIDKMSHNQKLMPSDLLNFLPFGLWAFSYVVEDFANNQHADFHDYVFKEQGLPLNDVYNWDKKQQNYGFQNDPLYFLYTDEELKNNPKINPTSIFIKDKYLQEEIFGYIPKFINYQIKSKIIGLSTEYSNFQPIGQTKLYD